MRMRPSLGDALKAEKRFDFPSPKWHVRLMAAYVISELEVLDEEKMQEYRRLAAASIAEHGGKYLVRGAQPQIVEGAVAKTKIVVVEFPSIQRAREWYTSASYARALTLRHEALERRLIFVDGIVSS